MATQDSGSPNDRDRLASLDDIVKAYDIRGVYPEQINADVTRALAPCIVHFFNHQTHHRGQVHAMLTAAGQKAPVSDMFLMPEDGSDG